MRFKLFNLPMDLVIGFGSRRLFWVDYETDTVHSSNLDRTDVQLVVQLSDGMGLMGIAVTSERIFWGHTVYTTCYSSLHYRVATNLANL